MFLAGSVVPKMLLAGSVVHKMLLQGVSWKLIFLNVLLRGIKSHLRAVIIWKILLIDFHFDIRGGKGSNVMLKF